jgi:hypothetical protein
MDKRFAWTDAVRYDDAQQFFGWPDRPQVFDPKGAGACVYADEVKRKIGAELQRQFPNLTVEAGILTADPNSNSTEAPIAIVCEFRSGVTEEALKQAHRLAWNFSRTALLITLEPHRLLAWSCWLDPQQKDESPWLQEPCELPKSPGATLNALQSSARDLLHWVSLITGNYLKQRPKKFPRDGRAETLLLENLRVVRQELLSLGLDREYCHDLLARIIFAQFLFHRKDSEGRPFLDENLLDGHCEGELKGVHQGLDTILADGDETYRFFRWLDGRFNGDLFPGKEGQTNAECDEAWRQEKKAVTRNPVVLQRLAEFVSGKLQLKDHQLTLWPEYSFDVIPLEFISSMYEEFLIEDKHKAKAYYTPPHLVDFVLDAALPWNEDTYDLKILDPCCGSGIFLVKAFQRLIHRWRRAHGRDPRISDLKPLLANNLWGVDRDREAVRVACFSLYLAMADAIEPKYYLHRQNGEQVFPRLRGIRLLDRDFFDEATLGIRTPKESEQIEEVEVKFDRVIGNAPWGDNSIKDTSDVIAAPAASVAQVRRKSKKRGAVQLTKAEVWARAQAWPVANNDIGPLFLAKGASLLRPDGQVAMVQPASMLLYQRAGSAGALRQKLFSSFTFDEVANLSAIRFELFPEVVGPACVVIFGRAKPAPEQTFLYFYPKPLRDDQADKRFVIEPQDVNQIAHREAQNDPLVWVALGMGTRRDLELVRRLARLRSLAELHAAGKILKREGIIRGNLGRVEEQIRGKRLFDKRRFPPGSFMELDADSLPTIEDCRVDADASTDFEPFKLPQLLIKQTWRIREGRFRASLVRSSDPEWGVICTQSYLSVRDMDRRGTSIKAAWLAYNSLLAAYFLTATSSRIGYRQEALVKEMLDVPLPPYSPGMLDGVHSPADVDARMRDAMQLTKAQWVLVEDFVRFVIPEAMQKRTSEGRQPTARLQGVAEEPSHVLEYARYFTRVLKATFGNNRAVCATIFEERDSERLPVRLVAIHLDWPGREALTVEPMDKNAILRELRLLYKNALSRKSRALSGEGLGFQRVAFLFHSHVEDGRRIPSLYIIKPDERRYWTRSLAMRDADQLAGQALLAPNHKRSKP